MNASAPQGRSSSKPSSRPKACDVQVEPRTISGATWFKPRLSWLLTTMALAVLLPALTFGFVATLGVVNSQRAIAEERLRDTARALALAVDREIGKSVVAMQAFAASLAFTAAAPLAAREELLLGTRRLAQLLGVTVNIVSLDGTILLTTAESLPTPGQLVRSLDLIATIVTTGEPSVGHVRRGVITDRWIIPIAVPVRDAGGHLAFIVGASIDADRVHQLLKAWDLDATSFAALSDAQNVVVARSDALHAQVVGRLVPPENAQRVSGQHAGLFRARGVDGAERVVGFQAVPSLPGWVVVVAQDQAKVDAVWSQPLLTLLLGGGLAVLMGVALAAAAAGAILRPARSLAEQARQLAEGKPANSLATQEPSRIAEFMELDRGLQEAIAATAARQRAESDKAQMSLSLGERTRALAEAGVELQGEAERRREAQSHLNQLQKVDALGQMTISVAHDFSNVLAAITACFRLIERRAGPNEAVQDVVRQGDHAAGRAAALVRQLLAFARHEVLWAEVVELGVLLPEAGELIRHTAGRRLAVSVEVPSGLWPVLTDPHQLEVALLNLAVNARDAMPQGGTLRVSARNLDPKQQPAELRDGDYVAIAVEDGGTGMPPDVLARAREPFFTTKPRGQGTGLGLPMVQRFAAQSNGALRIESVPGQGTSVEIILPRAAVTDLRVQASSADASGDGEVDPQAHGDASILLVKEDEQVRLLTAAFLRDLGYTVMEAASAEAAEALAAGMQPLHLLLSSVELPGADGATLAARLRTQQPDLRVIFVTGSPPGPALNGEIVLREPVGGADLAAVVLTALDRRRPLRSRPAARLLKRLRTPDLRAAYLAWHAARLSGENLPRTDAFRLNALGLEECSFLLSVESVPDKDPIFQFVRVGHALQARLGHALDGEGASGTVPDAEAVGTMAGAYRRCARTAAPVYESAQFDFGDGQPQTFERLVLPLSISGISVTHEVGVVVFGGDTFAPATTAIDHEQ